MQNPPGPVVDRERQKRAGAEADFDLQFPFDSSIGLNIARNDRFSARKNLVDGRPSSEYGALELNGKAALGEACKYSGLGVKNAHQCGVRPGGRDQPFDYAVKQLPERSLIG